MNIKVSNIYINDLNVKIRSLILLTTFTCNLLSLNISTTCLIVSNPTQPIMARTCNSIIHIILSIRIISCIILYRVISFENYTHTHCGFFGCSDSLNPVSDTKVVPYMCRGPKDKPHLPPPMLWKWMLL